MGGTASKPEEEKKDEQKLVQSQTEGSSALAETEGTSAPPHADTSCPLPQSEKAASEKKDIVSQEQKETAAPKEQVEACAPSTKSDNLAASTGLGAPPVSLEKPTSIAVPEQQESTSTTATQAVSDAAKTAEQPQNTECAKTLFKENEQKSHSITEAEKIEGKTASQANAAFKEEKQPLEDTTQPEQGKEIVNEKQEEKKDTCGEIPAEKPRADVTKAHEKPARDHGEKEVLVVTPSVPKMDNTPQPAPASAEKQLPTDKVEAQKVEKQDKEEKTATEKTVKKEKEDYGKRSIEQLVSVEAKKEKEIPQKPLTAKENKLLEGKCATPKEHKKEVQEGKPSQETEVTAPEKTESTKAVPPTTLTTEAHKGEKNLSVEKVPPETGKKSSVEKAGASVQEEQEVRGPKIAQDIAKPPILRPPTPKHRKHVSKEKIGSADNEKKPSKENLASSEDDSKLSAEKNVSNVSVAAANKTVSGEKMAAPLKNSKEEEQKKKTNNKTKSMAKTGASKEKTKGSKTKKSKTKSKQKKKWKSKSKRK